MSANDELLLQTLIGEVQELRKDVSSIKSRLAADDAIAMADREKHAWWRTTVTAIVAALVSAAVSLGIGGSHPK